MMIGDSNGVKATAAAGVDEVVGVRATVLVCYAVGAGPVDVSWAVDLEVTAVVVGSIIHE
ncbi:MAG: hypothetical protein OXQ29_05595 [Rhodospirillaceae bacterium]|nr:hypothetical protein [Rhodospirillaceae bacterium]